MGEGKREHWRVIDRKLIHLPIYRIVFENENRLVSKFYPGVSFAGCYFAVMSRCNFQARYYTLVNCMGVQFYERYLDLIRAFEEGEPPQHGFSTDDVIEDSTLELVIKQYTEATAGISQQVHA